MLSADVKSAELLWACFHAEHKSCHKTLCVVRVVTQLTKVLVASGVHKLALFDTKLASLKIRPELSKFGCRSLEGHALSDAACCRMSETMESKMRRFSLSEGKAAYRRSSSIEAFTPSHSDSALILASASSACAHSSAANLFRQGNYIDKPCMSTASDDEQPLRQPHIC